MTGNEVGRLVLERDLDEVGTSDHRRVYGLGVWDEFPEEGRRDTVHCDVGRGTTSTRKGTEDSTGEGGLWDEDVGPVGKGQRRDGWGPQSRGGLRRELGEEKSEPSERDPQSKDGG